MSLNRFSLCFPGRIHMVIQKDIQPDRLPYPGGVAIISLPIFRFKNRTGFIEPREYRFMIEAVRICINQIQAVPFLFRDLLQTLIIRTKHSNVDIVIPGYEPLVTLCAKGGTPDYKVWNLIRSTDPVQLLQHVQFRKLKLSEHIHDSPLRPINCPRDFYRFVGRS